MLWLTKRKKPLGILAAALAALAAAAQGGVLGSELAHQLVDLLLQL